MEACKEETHVMSVPVGHRFQLAGASLVIVWLLLPGFLSDSIPAFRDTLHFYFPLWHYLDQQSWMYRWVPTWNPMDAMGSSLGADPSTAAFYPLRWIFLLPGISLASKISLYLGMHLLLALGGAYRLGCRAGLSPMVSSLMATCYALSGPVYFQIYNPIFLVSAAWLPWVAREMVAAWCDGYRTKQILGVAVGLALMILGGDPQTGIHACLLFGILVVVQGAWQGWSFAWTRLIGLVLSGVVAMGLASIQILPTWNWWMLGQRGGIQSETYEFSVAPWHYVTLFFPRVLGSYAGVNSRWIAGWEAEGRMWVPSLHMGTIAILAMIHGVFARTWLVPQVEFHELAQRNRFSMRWWLGMASIAGGSALGAYGIGWMLHCVSYGLTGSEGWDWISDPMGGLQWIWLHLLPGYASFRYPAKWLVVFALAMCMVAGFAMQRVVWQTTDDGRLPMDFRTRCVGLVALILAVVTSIPIVKASFQSWCTTIASDPLCGPLQGDAAWFVIRSSLLGVLLQCFVWELGGHLRLRGEKRLWLWGIVLLLELGWMGQSETYYVSTSRLMEAAKTRQAVDEEGWVHLAEKQAAMRLGKMHLLLPVRNWNAQFTLTPDALHRHWAVTDQQRSHAYRVLHNAGWNSRMQASWKMIDASGEIVEGVHAKWMKPTELHITKSTTGAAEVLLPLFQDGGWSTESLNPGLAAVTTEVDALQLGLRLPSEPCEVVLRYHMPGLRIGAVLTMVFSLGVLSMAIALKLTSRNLLRRDGSDARSDDRWAR